MNKEQIKTIQYELSCLNVANSNTEKLLKKLADELKQSKIVAATLTNTLAKLVKNSGGVW